jgi:alpha-maltose-1-phosphate synthase
VTFVRIDILSKEYPPLVYGGAGVHVAELARALRGVGDLPAQPGPAVPPARPGLDVRVRCFGPDRPEPGTTGYRPPATLDGANPALSTLGVDLAIAQDCAGAGLVHSHTWYANLAGHLAALLHDLPHVVTAHSLEPLRPWKAEQLGGGYAVSSWAERTAYQAAAAVIAVSAGMRADVLRSYPEVDPARVHVVHNGIDTVRWSRREQPDAVRALGVDPDRRSVLFVGRITRQKGLPYFLRAVADLPPDVQVVLCAGSPDTPQIMAQVKALVADLRRARPGVVWIDRMLEQQDVVALLSCATAFVCPSVYEPLGIVNLEAMACEVPVVGTATGGIPEVVADGVTGRLVPIDQTGDGTGTPTDPGRFVADLGAAMQEVVADPARARAWGLAGRRRAVEEFGWTTVAARTVDIYRSVAG